MTTLAEAIVLAVFTLAPFVLALCVAAVIVRLIGEARIARALRLPWDGDGR